MNEKYTIDETSKFLNIPKSTLRYYDSIDLCKPEMRDEKTGYRYYAYSQLLLLAMIEKLKKLRLSLDQIKSHSRIKNIIYLEKILLERRQIINNEIEDLQEIKEQNETLIRKIEQCKTLRSNAAIEVRRIPVRYLYRMNLNFSIDELYGCIKILYASYIKCISSGPSYEKGEIALEISRDNLLKKQFGIYNAIGFFVNNKAGLKVEQLSAVPASDYAVACHTGSYKSISKTYKKLYRYIEEQGFSITGNSVETSLINIGMTNNPEEFMTEIQIPVAAF